ncbi:Spore coat protein U (SCPU) domain-containing protein [Sphingopyxis sp. YR583]|uniref:Csu type fimbrial protein n=1 Tax=Sphingopyxis sp. YR583 TaxID=1881047 RepID=UPI0008A78CB5|nr:spore coat U domain-containing protein [Sphingopyxis sp. YR583]SEH12314.1 Spore coat protein U (SCPU) domain-containing protein [Sphingopyxis sp. YR583]
MTSSHPASALATVVALVACYPVAAQAETTAQFDVSATIVAGCLVDGFGGSGNAGRIDTLDFGVDSTFSTALHTATTTGGQAIRLRCTPGANLTMSIDGGGHAAAGIRNLQLGANSGARIAYSLCRDAGCTQLIAIGTPYAVSVSGTNSEDVRLPIYGRLTLPGTRPPGTYTDALTVTLTW